ncbi:MAG: PDZ domain-containing protein [Deltaproteobacteria bacterium]|nr:PDZ domain-containing protein [Deltaproteobacteria bacterium]
MRRTHALLLTAGLAATPAIAAAGPHSHQTSVETFSMSSSKSRLGVTVLGITPELRTHLGASTDRGVLVARVEPRSPAALAGIAVGDVLLEVNGRKVHGAADVLAALSGIGEGHTVALRVVRDHKVLTLDAMISTEAPDAFDHQRLRELMKRHPSLFDDFFDDSWFDDGIRDLAPVRPHVPRAPTKPATIRT